MAYIKIQVDGVQCDLCNARMIGSHIDAGRAGWDWYTGKESVTKHACYDCCMKPEWEALKAMAFEALKAK